MQPCGFCSSRFPVCWHNPVIRPKQRINCSSNSRLPLIHLLKPLSLPQPVWFSTPGLAWRSLRLITSKDLINVLSLYKTVWSAPCIRKGQSFWGIFDCEFLTFFCGSMDGGLWEILVFCLCVSPHLTRCHYFITNIHGPVRISRTIFSVSEIALGCYSPLKSLN